VVTIDHEFKDWIIPLRDDEYKELEKSILEDGCRDPLVLWGDIVVDGHHRHKICTKHNIPFKTVDKIFPNRDSVKLWMVSNQIARRNLESIQRIALVMKGEALIAERAREQQLRKPESVLVNLPKQNPIDTRKEVAAQAKVSEKTYAKGKEVLLKRPEVMNKIIAGETSIHKEYVDIHREEKKAERQSNIIHNPVLPDGKYDVIYADPPWEHTNDASLTRNVNNKYPTMTPEKLKNLVIPYENNSVLLMWTTTTNLREAFDVMEAWGYKYKSSAIWDKQIRGIGYWFRNQHEILLLGVKGVFRTPEPEDRVSSVYSEKRGEHSKKPEYYYEMIEKMFPNKKYLELFARHKHSEKWTVWGNQV
jgi:N6-adenosine-specific RNA methylase IME4